MVEGCDSVSRKPRIWYEGALYHIINRGNKRQDIFFDTADRYLFLTKLRDLVDNHGLKVHAYCLMRNHYHLALETSSKHIADTMHALNTFYSKQHHAKYGTSGHLFQGRYRSILVEKDAYLLEVSRYIHLNPVGPGLVKLPEHYPWSSMRAYTEEFTDDTFVYRDAILGFFNKDAKIAKESYRRFVHAKLEEPDAIDGSITYDDILGSKMFVKEVRAEFRFS